MTYAILNRKTATALITGTLLGAGIALLYAPQSGRKTRRDIGELAHRVGSKTDAVRIEWQNSIDNMIGDMEEKLQEGLASGRDWTNGKMVDLRRALGEARSSRT